MKKAAALFLPCLLLAACASDEPRVVQTIGDMPEVRLTGGLATQIEMPESERVQSVVTGRPDLLSVERAGGVVNLVPKENSGETNLIIRAVDEYKRTKTYQYRVIVQSP